MPTITRSQTRHLRLPDICNTDAFLSPSEEKKKHEMLQIIRNGMNNCDNVTGFDYKMAVTLILFQYLESEKESLHLLGRKFSKTVSSKMNELIHLHQNVPEAFEFIQHLKQCKENLHDYFVWGSVYVE